MATFVVEGCIGAGKSRTLSYMSGEMPDWAIFEEPVHDWTEYNPRMRMHTSLLQAYYEQQSDRSFRLLQVRVISLSLLLRTITSLPTHRTR